MSLRYRLFLWVSGLFVVISLCSYVMENAVARYELRKAQQMLGKEILDISEKRRIDMQSYLASVIAEDAIRIDAILDSISGFSPQALRFSPTSNNEKNGTWGDSSDLLLGDKWIDFIQNTSQGKTTAVLIPKPTMMNAFYRVVIDKDLSWVYNGKQVLPYLGVRIPYSLIASIPLHARTEVLEQVPGAAPEGYLLFDVKKLQEASATGSQPIFEEGIKKVWPSIQVKWTEGYELDLQTFVDSFRRGWNLIAVKKIQPPQFSLGELKKKIAIGISAQGGTLNPIPEENLLSSISNEQLMKKRFEEIALDMTQIHLIWINIAMFDSGVFGGDLFSFPSPEVATVFSDDNAVGVGIDTNEVLFPEKIFDDSAYYQSNASKDPRSNLATSLAIIPSPLSDRIYLGNTAQFLVKTFGESKVGYLTLAIDSDLALQKLVLAIQQVAILVHNGKPQTAFRESGEKIDILTLDLPIAKMLQENSGIISWEGQNYFFMHVQPFSNIDLHFFLLNPEAKEFALLHDLESGSQKVVDAIRLNTHLFGLIALIIAIFLLGNISRNITRPIIQLAHAADNIVEGRLEEVKLSLPPSKHKDEIATLCHSFEKMVKGLQEKEKVQGVLNKVVSKEIAEEILKGSIHLGGEEKKVSVLFADIREFTKMTQNMPPQEVIDLLNTCMTKISQIIDKNSGVIDKYVGDEAMALFGAPISRSEDAFNAIKSALEMIQSLKEWNEERKAQGQPIIEIGVGIHTGKMLAGNMGAENRLNYTVIGSHVNLAYRLCSSAKRMEILITKDTLEEPFVKERVVFEPTPPIALKGFDQPIDVYRVIRIKK